MRFAWTYGEGKKIYGGNYCQSPGSRQVLSERHSTFEINHIPPRAFGGAKQEFSRHVHSVIIPVWDRARWPGPHLFRVPEVPPEGVVDTSRGLLGVARHGLHKHLERALQQHVDAAVVVVVVAATATGEVSGRGSADARASVRLCVCERHSPYPVETVDVVPQGFPQRVRVHALVHGHPVVRQVAHNLK